MDLILLDKDFTKIEPIKKFSSFDSVVGLGEYSDNDFILKVPYSKKLFEKGQIISYGLTEFGGRIASRSINTEKGEVTYKGYSIRGFWQRNHTDVADVTVSGDIVSHISKFIGWYSVSMISLRSKTDIINNLGDEKLTITYPGANSLLQHIEQALKSFGATMNISIANTRLKIVIEPVVTHYFDSSSGTVEIDENWSSPTAVYAVNNELKIGAYAYLQENGTAGNTPFYKGTDVIETIVQSTATTAEELYHKAANELLKKQKFMASEIKVDITKAEVDDSVVASIAEIGLKVKKTIVEKRLVIKNNTEKITYTLEG